MLYYNFIYLLPALVVILNLKDKNKLYGFVEYFFLLLLVIFVGLSYQIGGDWIWYLRNFEIFGNINFLEFNYSYNYGFVFINWFFYKIGASYYFVKIFCALLLVISIKFFFTSFKIDRLLAYCIFFPLGIVVISMGFVRQGCALSFLMISLTFLLNKKYLQSYIFFLIGVSFHKSMLIFFPILYIISPKYKLIIPFILLIFIYFFYDHLSHLIKIYLGSEKGVHYDVSRGSYVRTIMTLMPAVLFITFFNTFDIQIIAKKILLYFSIFIIIISFLTILYPTFVDRILLYLVFFQAIIYSLFCELFSLKNKMYLKSIFVLIYLFILNFFLNFGFHANFWIPYKNILLYI